MSRSTKRVAKTRREWRARRVVIVVIVVLVVFVVVVVVVVVMSAVKGATLDVFEKSLTKSQFRQHRDVQRRTWDVEEYEQRAKEREKAERAGKQYKSKEEREAAAAAAKMPKRTLDGLERPDMDAYQVESMVGQRRVVTAENALSEQGGFYCEACDYLLKDHKAYLEHCNKPRHLQAMGLPMHVKRADAESVKNRLALHKQLDKEKQPGKDKAALLLKQKRAAEKKAHAEEKSRDDDKEEASQKKPKKDVAGVVDQGELEFDPAMFGLPSGFGSSKK